MHWSLIPQAIPEWAKNVDLWNRYCKHVPRLNYLLSRQNNTNWSLVGETKVGEIRRSRSRLATFIRHAYFRSNPQLCRDCAIAIWLWWQGVVTYMSPVEGFVTGIKIFDRQKNVLDRLIIPSKALYRLIFTGQRSNWSCTFLILSFSQFTGYLDLLIGSQKGFWSLDSILILVTNTSTRNI